MRIGVAILPGQRFNASVSVCVVIDVLRASSSIVTLLERGCEAVVVATDIEEARRLHRVLPDYLLCGEAEGLPPEGFDYGNSPVEFSRLELAGKSAVLAGCLLNRTAVARAALAIAAGRGLDITVVCSAAYGGSVFVLEDALGAGAIVDAALAIDANLIADDAARFARDSFAMSQVRIAEAVCSAYHAQELIDAGLGEDVAYCGQLDTSSVVPLLERGEGGMLMLRTYGT